MAFAVGVLTMLPTEQARRVATAARAAAAARRDLRSLCRRRKGRDTEGRAHTALCLTKEMRVADWSVRREALSVRNAAAWAALRELAEAEARVARLRASVRGGPTVFALDVSVTG